MKCKEVYKFSMKIQIKNTKQTDKLKTQLYL